VKKAPVSQFFLLLKYTGDILACLKPIEDIVSLAQTYVPI
jgi:hypothetical protein